MLVVGVGDYKVSDNPAEVITTYALGSCIGMTIYDPVARIGGMLHFMLPDSSLDISKAQARPCMFADTGIITLLQALRRLGAVKSRAQVRLAGGAQMLDAAGIFNIGKRNYAAARKILWQAGFMIQSEEVGGTASRTIRLDIASGQTWIRATATGDESQYSLRTGGQEWQLMC
jgi:chemotaxis protein CheD